MIKVFVKRSICCRKTMKVIDLILTLFFWPSDYSNLVKTVEYYIIKPLMNWLIQ